MLAARLGLLVLLLAACSGDDDPIASGPPAIPDPVRGPSVVGDIDGDGRADARDNCPSIANRDRRRACDYPEAPVPTGDVVSDGVAHLSWTRSLVGLGPVVNDAELTHGCEIHLAYLRRRSEELGEPVLTHEEDLSLDYASEEGNDAGIASVLSIGRGGIAEAIDGWMGTLYHRLPLIHPGLARVGVAAGDGYACVQYAPGTDARAAAPYPILWPPPDLVGAARAFAGSESPCPTVDDPFAGGARPGSATIASIGLNGMGAMSDVSATLARLDTGDVVPLFRLYYDGGPTEHEQQGYLDGTIALVPEPGSTLDRAAVYEVTVDAALSGAAQTFRWRFATGRPLPVDVP
ncbi:MAG: thrombospondin type 3 repeat-containing protein, partial [Deltaproteobacteria bacterium]|nr:thrombospondin type 3 repeat-containing protein [Deltaproteobacteria bacterium]